MHLHHAIEQFIRFLSIQYIQLCNFNDWLWLIDACVNAWKVVFSTFDVSAASTAMQWNQILRSVPP